MTRILRITALAGAVLSFGIAGKFVYGQEGPSDEQVEISELPLVDQSVFGLVSVRGQEPPYELTLNGVRGTTKREMGPMNSDGTYVRADEFRIDDGVAEAVGNVTIVVRDGESTIVMTADRLMVEGRQ